MTYKIGVQQVDTVLLIVADDNTRATLGSTGCLLAVARASVDMDFLALGAEKQTDGVAVRRGGKLVLGTGNTTEDLDVIKL